MCLDVSTILTCSSNDSDRISISTLAELIFPFNNSSDIELRDSVNSSFDDSSKLTKSPLIESKSCSESRLAT